MLDGFAIKKKFNQFLTILNFSTPIDIPQPQRQIGPSDRLLFVGSCFADGVGSRMRDNAFDVEVNPYGTMYNPVSVRHAVERYLKGGSVADWVFLTLGTNHVYRLRDTGEVVDNCQKRPQRLFCEESLSVGECAYQLRQTLGTIGRYCPDAQVVLTVSPIRYAKYGFHESQLSKATLLLAAAEVCSAGGSVCCAVGPHRPVPACYFPAYELLMDELRDYRFYKPDMLHPSEQAVDYVWQRLHDTFLSAEARRMVQEWQPIRQALGHRPLRPDSEAYIAFADNTRRQIETFNMKYNKHL